MNLASTTRLSTTASGSSSGNFVIDTNIIAIPLAAMSAVTKAIINPMLYVKVNTKQTTVAFIADEQSIEANDESKENFFFVFAISVFLLVTFGVICSGFVWALREKLLI